MKQAIIAAVLFSACTPKVANYKITPSGSIIWRYTKPGELRKDILSNGDTLCTNPKTGDFYITHPVKLL